MYMLSLTLISLSLTLASVSVDVYAFAVVSAVCLSLVVSSVRFPMLSVACVFAFGVEFDCRVFLCLSVAYLMMSCLRVEYVCLGVVALLSFVFGSDALVVGLGLELLSLVVVGVIFPIDASLAFRYLVVSWGGSVLYFLGCLCIYLTCGALVSFDVSSWMVSLGIAVKLGIGPSVGMYVSLASGLSGISMRSVDVALKLPVIALVTLAPGVDMSFMLILGCLTMALGGVGLAFSTGRVAVAYSGCLQLGLLLVAYVYSGLSAGTEMYVVVYAVSSSIWWRIVEVSRGLTSATRALVFTLMMSLFGMPGTSGFAVKLGVYVDMVAGAGSGWVLLLIAGVMFLSIGYVRLCGILVRDRVDGYVVGTFPMIVGVEILVMLCGWVLLMVASGMLSEIDSCVLSVVADSLGMTDLVFVGRVDIAYVCLLIDTLGCLIVSMSLCSMLTWCDFLGSKILLVTLCSMLMSSVSLGSKSTSLALWSTFRYCVSFGSKKLSMTRCIMSVCGILGSKLCSMPRCSVFFGSASTSIALWSMLKCCVSLGSKKLSMTLCSTLGCRVSSVARRPEGGVPCMSVTLWSSVVLPMCCPVFLAHVGSTSMTGLCMGQTMVTCAYACVFKCARSPPMCSTTPDDPMRPTAGQGRGNLQKKYVVSSSFAAFPHRRQRHFSSHKFEL